MGAAILRQAAQLRRVGVAAAVAATAFWIAFDGGSYASVDRGVLAIASLWAVALAVSLGLWPLAPPPLAALITGGLLAALVLLTGLSALWGESAERGLEEANRVALYLAAFALAVVASRRSDLLAWLAGLAVGLTGIGLLALGSRLFPGLTAETAQLAQLFAEAERRLSYPVNYWNGLAILIAFALPLLLFFATSLRSPAARGIALAPTPALAGTIYLTSSRGGTVAALLAAGAFVALAGRRWAAGAAGVVGGIGATVVIALLAARPELVDRPLESDLAASQGRSAALLIVLICAGVGALWALGSHFAPAPPRVPLPTRVALILVVFGLIGAVVAVADPRERLERFKEVPPSLNSASVQEHLLSGSGNGRWQLWQVALDDFERHPLLGRGAGTYEASWAEHGSLPLFVRDAHSLYLETLGELGLLGLLLLGGILLSGLVAAGRRILAAAGDEQSAVAALGALVLAYLFEAGFDWMWEFTAASVVAFVALGLMTGPATLPASGAAVPGRRTTLRAAAFTTAMALLLLQTTILLSDVEIRDSQTAAARGDLGAALNDAKSANSLAPWAASPQLQLALVQELGGQIEEAEASITEAVERDPLDWRLRIVAARIQTMAGDFAGANASLREAERLNPRSELFRER